jgi:hypothetical protein
MGAAERHRYARPRAPQPCAPVLVATFRNGSLFSVERRHNTESCCRLPCFGQVDPLPLKDW